VGRNAEKRRENGMKSELKASRRERTGDGVEVKRPEGGIFSILLAELEPRRKLTTERSRFEVRRTTTAEGRRQPGGATTANGRRKKTEGSD